MTDCPLSVTDMLAAVLNTCTKEELEEIDEETVLVSPVSVTPEESVERRRIIKNKIMAVGRMARVFALLRSVNPSSREPLTICYVIGRNQKRSQSLRAYRDPTSFLMVRLHREQRELGKPLMASMMRECSLPVQDVSHLMTHLPSRKSDIENERLPPDLFDADSEEGKAMMSSLPTTPSENPETVPPPFTPNGVATKLEKVISAGSALTSINTKAPPVQMPSSPVYSPTSPTSPTTPISPSLGGFKRGHSRQASLGTTMTSPSTRRRSLENTMSLIQGVWDGQEMKEGVSAGEGQDGRLTGSSMDKHVTGTSNVRTPPSSTR